MVFNSLHFTLFAAIVLPLLIGLRGSVRLRNVALILAGYYFYGWWDWRFLGLLILTTFIDYFCARAIDRAIWNEPGNIGQRRAK